MFDERLLTTEELARRLRVTTGYLARLRGSGEGPEFVKLGKRIVLYAPSSVEAWLKGRRRRSTSDPGLEISPSAGNGTNEEPSEQLGASPSYATDDGDACGVYELETEDGSS